MTYSCPACAQRLSCSDDFSGLAVVCPLCQHRFIWPKGVPVAESFVIYDLETTGLYPESDEFIQIAAMRFHGGDLCRSETFMSFARPRKTISAFIESYTGVGNREVRNAPRPEEVLKDFSVWVGGATLVAHNGLRFDSKFLEATCRRHGLPTRVVENIDSIHLSKMCFGNARGIGHGLDRVVERLAIGTENVRRHDARGDVELLGQAVSELRRKLGLDRTLAGVPRHLGVLPAL